MNTETDTLLVEPRSEEASKSGEGDMSSIISRKIVSIGLGQTGFLLRNTATENAGVWIFGYGSLMWKRGQMKYQQDMVGYVKGMARRFWQGSPDHRGKPGAPGRVLTLAEKKDVTTWGTAIKVHPDSIPSIDLRETGYVRKKTTFYPSLSSLLKPFEVEIYIAKEDNPHYLGPASLEQQAQDIAFSIGQSGCNAEYLLALCDYLNHHNVMKADTHLIRLEKRVRELLQLAATGDVIREHGNECKCVYHRRYLLSEKEPSKINAHAIL